MDIDNPPERLLVCGFKDKTPDNAVIVNTTSRSDDFGKNFSPFMNQGPIELYGLRAHNVENLYQHLKVHQEHLDNPQAWLKWRDAGLANPRALRYPMGKGNNALFGYINKEMGRLSYIEGRKRIYIPAYLQKLDRYYGRWINSLLDMLTTTEVWLWDFDGRTTDESFDQILHNEAKHMGHAFIVQQYCYDLILGTDKVLRYRMPA